MTAFFYGMLAGFALAAALLVALGAVFSLTADEPDDSDDDYDEAA